jgi:hypothetical protein
MVDGALSAYGLIAGLMDPKSEPRVLFTVSGTPTSANPITALKQGLADERTDASFWVKGLRCSGCGFLELFAEEQATV